jgi:hypothetical protein
VAVITQPLAGIPAFLFVVLMNINHAETKFKKFLVSLILIIISITLPVLFYVFENTPETKVEINNNLFPSIISSLTNTANNSPVAFIPQKENVVLNYLYLYGFNIKLIIFLLFISGFYLFLKNKKECKYFIHFFLIFLALYISYLLSSSLSFSFLVDYERSDYTNRILLVASFFLIPFIILAIYNFLFKLKEKIYPVKIPIFIFLALLITTSLYFSYPRFDHYHNSHGISTGIYDIEATKWIEDNNKKQFAVLANQQVSAAALKNFGFNKYFSNNIFYYPIPTSSPLYQNYLDMVYDKPSKKNAQKAMNLLNINEVYFILNKYWWAFPKILDEAKLEADSFVSFGNDDVFVFKYTK